MMTLWVLFLGRLLGVTGAHWDVAWHRTLGRDSFWSPPHLLIYGSLAIMTVVPTYRLVQGRHARSDRVVLAGALIVYLSAPIDELWHRWYGIDVDIWSPPHLLGIAGAFVVSLGVVLAAKAQLSGWWLVLFAAPLLDTPMFALGRFTIAAVTRDAVLYPSLLTIAAVPVLIAVRRLTGLRGAAVATAAWYVATTSLTAAALGAAGFRPVSPPPLIVLSALVIDLAPRGGGLVAAAGAGVAFATISYVVEAEWRVMLGAAPWRLGLVAIGLPVALVTGAIAGVLGQGLAAACRWREPGGGAIVPIGPAQPGADLIR